MKKSYTLLLAAMLLLFNAGCSKEHLPGNPVYIEGGPWYVTEMRSSGTGPLKNSDFSNGTFTFLPGKRLEYHNKWMELYEGTWDLQVYSYTDEYDQQQESYALKITATNAQTQHHLSEYYGDVKFSGANCFTASVYTPNRVYTFEFRK